MNNDKEMVINELFDFKKNTPYRGIIIKNLKEHPIQTRPQRGHSGSAYFDLADNKTIDAHISEIPPKGQSNNHRHLDEAVIYIMCGKGYTLLETTDGQKSKVDWEEGDLFSPPLYAWHQHFNTGDKPARYLAITNVPLMHSLGVFTKEESGS